MKRIIIYCSLWGMIHLLINDFRTQFTLLSLLIVISSVSESYFHYKKYGMKVILSPFVICCIYLFAVNFGISNFIYIIPSYEQFMGLFLDRFFPNLQDFYFWLSQGLDYVFTGFLFLVAGYRVEEKTKIVTNFTHFLFKTKRLLIKNFDIRLWKVLVLWIFSCGIKVFAISKGLYGFTASSVALDANKGIVQFIYYGTIVSKGALFFLCLLYFLKPKILTNLFALILVLTVELFFGLLSGFKSQIMFPFIIVLFANIIISKKVQIKFIIPIIFSVFLAYGLVEPMRAASYGYGSDKTVDAGELIEIAATGIKEESINEEEALPFLYVFMSRNSLSVFVAMSCKELNLRKRFYPHFAIQEKLLFSPFLAYVPRAVWPDKPIISNGGVIFNREVLGAPEDDNVSIAISPIGYFLLGTENSFLYIIIFFFLLGMLQYYIFHLYLNFGLGGLIVCLGMLVTLAMVEEPYTVSISYFKDLPIFIVFQFLFLARFKNKVADTN